MMVEARKESCSDMDHAFMYIYITLLKSAYCSLYHRHTHRLVTILRNPSYYKCDQVIFCNVFTATIMASVLELKTEGKLKTRFFSEKDY